MSSLKKYSLIFTFYFLICYNNYCQTFDDLYSSVPALEKAFKTEKLYLENSEIYLKYATVLLDSLKRKIFEFKSSDNLNFTIREKLRFNYAMGNIKKTNYIGFSRNISQYRDSYRFPSNTDLEGVTLAINRLKEVYHFSVKDIVDGNFLKFNIKNSKKLSFKDCFEIGRQLFQLNKLMQADEWLEAAYELYEHDENSIKPIELWEILDVMARLKFKFGNIVNMEEAIQLIKKALKLNPNSVQLKLQLKQFREEFENIYNANQFSRLDYEVEVYKYQKGCRGKYYKSPSEIRKLYCTYKNGPNSFLKIAPFKLEVQNLQPYVAVFHNIVYDQEINLLKNISEKELARATVWDSKLGVSKPSEFRTSKFAWLENEKYPFMDILNQRLSDMTDMTMETSEALQLMNYGIGGHYDVHSDFFPESMSINDDEVRPYTKYDMGNRIATVLFYLSDVEQGGATVFPHLNIAVLPKKGAAAFWFNLFPSGEGNLKTRHAACPVIFGSKWVANKWIRHNGQMSWRPCKLKEYHHFEAFKRH